MAHVKAATSLPKSSDMPPSEADDDRPKAFTYIELDQPKHAVHLTCFDVKLVKSLPPPASESMWLHRKRPTVFVHVVGRVVELDVRDLSMKFTVDDGSAVLDVNHRYKKPRVVPVKVASAPAGVPSQYIRPAALPTEANEKPDPLLMAEAFRHSIKHIELCKLVSVTGRLGWTKAGFHIQVDRIVPLGKDSNDPKVRSMKEGYVEVCTDPNAEMQHILRAIRLADGEYEEACAEAVASLDQQVKKRGAPDSNPAPRIRKYVYADSVRTSSPPRPQLRVKSPRRTDTRSCQPLRSGKQTLVSAKDPSALAPIQPASKPSCASDRFTAKTAAVPRPLAEGEAPHARERPRKLRDFRKLAGNELTQQTLCIYVQKHINDYCRAASLMAVVQEPPAFTIAYLMRVTDLRELALRFTKVQLRRLQQKRAKAGASHVVSSEGLEKKVERFFEHVIRTVVADGMVVIADRSTPVAAPYNGKRPATSSVLSRVDPEGLLDWDGVAADERDEERSTVASADTSMMRYADPPTSRQQCEAYQAVTPAVLAFAVARVLRLHPLPQGLQPEATPMPTRITARLGTSAHAAVVSRDSRSAERAPPHVVAAAIETLSSASTEHVHRKVRLLDSRWQSVLHESVTETMLFLRALYQKESTA